MGNGHLYSLAGSTFVRLCHPRASKETILCHHSILAGSTFVVFVPGLTQMQTRPTQTLGQEAQRKHAFGRLSTDV